MPPGIGYPRQAPQAQSPGVTNAQGFGPQSNDPNKILNDYYGSGGEYYPGLLVDLGISKPSQPMPQAATAPTQQPAVADQFQQLINSVMVPQGMNQNQLLSQLLGPMMQYELLSSLLGQFMPQQQAAPTGPNWNMRNF